MPHKRMGVRILSQNFLDDESKRRLSFWRQQGEPPCEGYVATDHCTSVGVLNVWSDGSGSHITIYVQEQQRSRGIGSGLLHYAIKSVPRPLYVECNARHVRWFLRNGFVRVGFVKRTSSKFQLVLHRVFTSSCPEESEQ